MSYDALVYVSTCLTMHVYLCAYEGGVGVVNLPNEMSSIGHSPDGTYSATYAGESECSSRFS